MLSALVKSILIMIIFCFSLIVHRLLIRFNLLLESQWWFWGSLVGVFFILLFLSLLIFSRPKA